MEKEKARLAEQQAAAEAERQKQARERQERAKLEATQRQVLEAARQRELEEMEYVETGIRLFPDDPWTVTRCLEEKVRGSQMVTGGFALAGLFVNNDNIGDGMTALRMF